MTKKHNGQTGKKRTQMELLRDRAFMSEHRLKGATAQECLEIINTDSERGYSLSITTIYNDFEAIRKEWKLFSVQALDARMSEELVKLALVERELWTAWEKSKTEIRVSKSGDEYEIGAQEKYMRLILAAMKQRQELLGLVGTPEIVQNNLGIEQTIIKVNINDPNEIDVYHQVLEAGRIYLNESSGSDEPRHGRTLPEPTSLKEIG